MNLADATIAKLEEIPACWGWLAATKHGLRVQRPAMALPGTGASIPRSFVIGVLRKLQEDLLRSPDVAVHIEERVKQITDRHDDAVRYATTRIQSEMDALNKSIAEFEEASGIEMKRWGMGDVGTIVRQLQKLGWGDGGLNTVTDLLEQQANALTSTLERVNQVRAEILQKAST
jgi:hypothetical protein